MTISMKKLVADAMAAGLLVDVSGTNQRQTITIRRGPQGSGYTGLTIWPDGGVTRFEGDLERVVMVCTQKEMRKILGL